MCAFGHHTIVVSSNDSVTKILCAMAGIQLGICAPRRMPRQSGAFIPAISSCVQPGHVWTLVRLPFSGREQRSFVCGLAGVGIDCGEGKLIRRGVVHGDKKL